MSIVEVAEHVVANKHEESRRDECQTRGDCDDFDDELLRRFLADRDESAFAQLVSRHGPVVMAVCRRVLWNEQDAEDAFQATFLVLSRKARSVRKSASLAAWLHKTAYRIALRARAGRSQRREHALEGEPMIVENSLAQIVAEHDRSVFDEELNRLPDKYRLPLFLCCVENKSREEAAKQLGWSIGALKGRLERGRRLLRSRLMRRGVSLGVLLGIALQSPHAVLAGPPIPQVLLTSTVRASMQYSAGKSMAGYVSQNALSLAEGSFEIMSYTTTKIVACCSLLIAALALTAHWVLAPAVAGGALEIDNPQAKAALVGGSDAPVAVAVAGKQPRAGIAPVAGQNRKPAAATNEPPTSIFNDKLRRFKFRLEHTDVVTVEESMLFMQRYSKRGNPEIVGAYADFDNNLLVVIGPPEAEQAIRKNLATAIIELHGVPGGGRGKGSLKAKKRGLQSKGREIIRDLAEIEAAKVKVAATKDKNRDKIMKQFDSQFKALEAELAVLSQQIHVVDKYLKRLDQQPFRAKTISN